MAFGGGALGSSALASAPLAGGYDIYYIGVATGSASVVGVSLSLFPATGSAIGYATVSGIGATCLDPHLKRLTSGSSRPVVNLSRHTC